jgi:transcriptional regulator NrdR family protein
MKCPRCDNSRLVLIEVTVGGQQLTMRRCWRCDSRSWHTQEAELALPAVLDLAGRRR